MYKTCDGAIFFSARLEDFVMDITISHMVCTDIEHIEKQLIACGDIDIAHSRHCPSKLQGIDLKYSSPLRPGDRVTLSYKPLLAT